MLHCNENVMMSALY